MCYWGIAAAMAAAPLAHYYGKVTADDGTPIANVPVTDGTEIVLTSDKGTYALNSNTARYIYLTLPDGYEVPTRGGLPTLYRKVPRDAKGKVRMDFVLKRSKRDNRKHVMIAWADPQIYFDEEIPQLREAALDVKRLLETDYRGVPAYGVVCGDIIGEMQKAKEARYYPRIIDTIGETGIPFFYVMGNHDMDLGGRSNETADSTFTSYFGPTWYSFNRGEVHYVVLYDVFYIAKDWLYIGYLTERQLAWLEQDLKQVPEGRTVVVNMHIPSFSREARKQEWNKEDAGKIVNNRRHLYKLLKPYNTHIFAGHEHYNENYLIDENLYEHVHAAVSNLFWQAPWGMDGVPGGYAVYEFDGGKVSWYFKCLGKDRDYQFKLYPPGSSDSHKESIIANVWNYDPTWKVRWFENGVPRGEMTRYTGYDPDIAHYADLHGKSFKHSFIGAAPTEHLFRAVPQTTDGEIRVEVTDRFGRVYTQILPPR
jgi:hypothetical protein